MALPPAAEGAEAVQRTAPHCFRPRLVPQMGTVRRGSCRWNGKGNEGRSILPQRGKGAEEPSFVDSIGNRIGLREQLRVTLEATKNGEPAGTCTLLNRLKAGYFAV